MVLAFPKIGWPVAGLVGLIPLRLAVEGLNFKRGFALGFVYGLSFGFGLLYWLATVMTTYGGLSGWLAGGILLLLVAVLAFYPAVWAGSTAALGRRTGGSTALFGAALWVGLEWVRSWLLTGFPWEDVGYLLTPWPVFVQMADLGGVGLAGWLVVSTNLVLAEWLLHPRRFKPAAACALIWAIAFGYGVWRLDEVRHAAREAPQVTVRVVQGNVDQNVKWDEAFISHMVEVYTRLSLEPHQPKPRLVIWPETAMPFYFRDDRPETHQLYELARRLDGWLLFGAPAYEQGPEGVSYFNRAYLLDPQGRRAGYFDKAHLIPYGEYVPFRAYTPFLRTVVKQVGDYSAGRPGKLVKADFAAIGVLICYESIFPELSRAHARAGAGLLANITNDSWFGRSSAPFQHLSMLTWRAVEVRRAAARAAQTGISALIGPDGEIIKRLELGKAGQITGDLPILTENTIYQGGGWLFSPASLIVALLAAVFTRRFSARERYHDLRL